jgi:1-acyl-sn-glycerol-3-phosphate acyltransferase
MMVVLWFSAIGLKRGQRPGPFRQWLLDLELTIGCRMTMLCFGVFWCERQQVAYDYSKYLGPDYKFDLATAYKGTSTYVANHQSFGDILLMLTLCSPKPGFISKEMVKKVFAVGYIADVVLKSLFVKRDDSKSKRGVLEQVALRQKEAVEGINTPVAIYPEGATTTGKGLLTFKKGPFAAL